MATYFEGFEWDGKTWKFGGASESRLPFVRDAMKGGRHIPLADLLGGEAIKIINSDAQKALLFYAECWSLNFFLVSTENKAHREAYAVPEGDRRGPDRPLTKFFRRGAAREGLGEICQRAVAHRRVERDPRAGSWKMEAGRNGVVAQRWIEALRSAGSLGPGTLPSSSFHLPLFSRARRSGAIPVGSAAGMNGVSRPGVNGLRA